MNDKLKAEILYANTHFQMNSDIQNDWHYLPLIKALVGLSALLHDWGKATALFQEKLNPKNRKSFKGDPIRHEWISLLLLKAFIHSTETSSDTAWLSQLSIGEINEGKLTEGIKKNEPQRNSSIGYDSRGVGKLLQAKKTKF